MANPAALVHLTELRRMLTSGTYASSYEQEIVKKIDEAIRHVAGPEIVTVQFFAPRADLLELFSTGEYYGQLPKDTPDPNALSTPHLLSIVLQYALYDSPSGPNMEGSYKLLPVTEEKEEE